MEFDAGTFQRTRWLLIMLSNIISSVVLWKPSTKLGLNIMIHEPHSHTFIIFNQNRSPERFSEFSNHVISWNFSVLNDDVVSKFWNLVDTALILKLKGNNIHISLEKNIF